MSRRLLILLAALIVVVVVVGIIVAELGNGGGGKKHPVANGPTTPVSSASTPAQPSACPLLSTATIGQALHVAVGQGVVTGPAGSRECTWRSTSGGTVVTLSVVNSGDELVLHMLGNNITGRVNGLGAFAVFAPSPPRLGMEAGAQGVLVTVGQAGYRQLLPKGSTDPRQIPKAKILPPLETLGKAAAAALK